MSKEYRIIIGVEHDYSVSIERKSSDRFEGLIYDEMSERIIFSGNASSRELLMGALEGVLIVDSDERVVDIFKNQIRNKTQTPEIKTAEKAEGEQ